MEKCCLPMFSIIMPTYNRDFLCARAVKSVVNQAEQSWELLVIDDGSADITQQLVESFNDKRIKYVWQQNAGAGAARNHGIRDASGKYICFLDSDDEILPNHLETLKRVIEANSNADAFYFTLGYIEYRGDRLLSPDYQSTLDVPILIGDNPDINGICISKNILDQYKFDEEIECNEDVELWGRIGLKHPVIKICERTFVTHFHDGSRITSNSLKHYLGMEKTYSLLVDTRDNRIKMPEPALNQKLKEINFGIVRNGWQREPNFFWKYYWKTVKLVGPSIIFSTQLNKAIVKHLLFGLGIYGRQTNCAG